MLPSRAPTANILGVSQVLMLGGAFPLQPDLSRLGSVVGMGHLLKPRMVESLFGGDAVSRVVNENLAQQVKEIFKERRVRRDDVLRWLASGLVAAMGRRGCTYM